jgi:SAM-dependent methyltransferase
MPKAAHDHRLWRSSGEFRGGAPFRTLFKRTFSRIFPALRPKHPFDLVHRVDTSGLIYAESLPSGHRHDQQSEGYYATAPSLFRGVIDAWRATLSGAGSNLNGYTIFDIGCGKGRVLLLASEYPFRNIVGVELHPGLAQTARSNLKAWMRTPRACGNVTIVAGDVFEVPFPDGPVVIYLFNSFGRELLQMLLDQLLAVSATRCDPIDLLYVHPEFGDLVRQTPRMELLADEEFLFSAEDAEADVFGVNFDRCGIYRLPGLLTVERTA